MTWVSRSSLNLVLNLGPDKLFPTSKTETQGSETRPPVGGFPPLTGTREGFPHPRGSSMLQSGLGGRDGGTSLYLGNDPCPTKSRNVVLRQDGGRGLNPLNLYTPLSPNNSVGHTHVDRKSRFKGPTTIRNYVFSQAITSCFASTKT